MIMNLEMFSWKMFTKKEQENIYLDLKLCPREVTVLLTGVPSEKKQKNIRPDKQIEGRKDKKNREKVQYMKSTFIKDANFLGKNCNGRKKGKI